MFKQAVLVLLFAAFAMANTPITGQVFSSNGNPLAYAVIANNFGNNWVIADDNGYFNFSTSLKQGDTLSVSRYGYQTDLLEITNERFYTISLLPAPIAGGPIIVSGSNNGFQGQITNTYSKTDDSENLQNLFHQIPGLSIRSYGGKAGLMNLSTNGNPTVNTKIILGDVDIASAQNGEGDLSQIPEVFFNSISVANSPGIFYGSGAVDGVLKLNPQQANSSISTSFGNYDYQSINGNYSKKWKQLSINLNAGYLKDDGDFKYIIDEESLTRENNDFERKYISLKSTIKLSHKSTFNAFLMESRQQRGAAGTITWASPFARKDDKLQLGNISYNHLNKSGYTKFQLNTRRSLENYDDLNPSWPINSEHTVYGNTVKIQHSQNIWNDVSANFLAEGKQEKIESTDVGNHTRNTQSLATEFSIPLLNKFKLFPAFRADKVGDSEFHPTQAIRITYDGLNKSELEYYIGTGFRTPTFSDLYWNPGGNSNLESETSWNQSLKFKYYFNNNYSNNIYLNIYDKHTEDLIQWVPIIETPSVWQSQNIARSRQSNITIGTRFSLIAMPLQVTSHATYQKTEDLILKKPLIYAPNVIGFIGLSYDFYRVNLGFQTHYTGERIASYGSENDTNLPAYWYTSATIMYKTELLGNTVSFLIDTANLLDKKYMSINGYPEPGRRIVFGIKYELAN